MAMVSSLRQLAGNAYTFWIITTLTCTSQIALIGITVGLATNNATIDASIHRTAWVTAAANMAALTASLGAVCLYVRRTARTVYLATCAIFVVFSALAVLLTIYTLTRVWRYIQDIPHLNKRDIFTQELAKAGFGVWTVALFTQALLYTLVFIPKQPRHDQTPAQELTQRSSPGRSVKRRLSDLTSLTPPPSPPYLYSPSSSSSSPKLSSHSLTPKSSLRHSVTQAVRPVTSKTKLLLRRDSTSTLPSTRHESWESLHHHQPDGFETWDTSAVLDPHQPPQQPQPADAFPRSKLDPIPGSRPVSPANPLNGPFPDPTESPQPPDSPLLSPTSETSSLHFPPTRPSSNQIGGSQSNIHPLFRSESPVPAPLASPGTVITASPFAGQIVSPRRLRSSTSFCREGSPTPGRSRQGSLRSLQLSPGGERRCDSPLASRLQIEVEKGEGGEGMV